MRTTVKAQLADYFQYVDEEQGPVDVDGIVEFRAPVLQLASHRPRTWRRSAFAAVTSAVGVFLVIGLVLMADPFSGSQTTPLPPVSSGPSGSTGPPVEQPPAEDVDDPTSAQQPESSAPTLRAEAVTWSRLSDVTGALGGEGDQFLEAVVEGGPGFVAVGAECPGYCPFLTPEGLPSVGPGLDDWVAAVWTSEDGSIWERLPHDEQVFGGEGDQAIMDIVPGGPGLVAVGWTDFGYFTGGMTDTFGDYPEEVGLLDGEIWVSADGIVWDRVADPNGVFTGPGNQMIEAVVAGGPGLVAVGFESTNPEQRVRGMQAAVWTSSDGYTWEKASLDRTELGPLGTVLHDVTVGGPGLVAVGVDYSMYVDFFSYETNAVPTVPGDPARQRSYYSAAVWVSADGLSWERVSPYDPVFGGLPESKTAPTASVDGGPASMDMVAAYDGGVIASGNGGWDLGVWLSDDGYGWTRVEEDDPAWDNWSDSGWAFAVDQRRVVQVGILSNENDLWGDARRRLDHETWGDFAIKMADVVVTEDGLLAVGSAGGNDTGFDAAIWAGEWDE